MLEMALTLAVLLAMAGASQLFGAPAAGEPDPLRITVTLPPQAWLVGQIAGERVDVRALVGPGDSPATFSPNDAQTTEVARSALFFRIGVPAENAPWFHAVERMGRPRIVDLREGIVLRDIEAHHHQGDHHPGSALDPHIWLSPERLRIMAGTVAQALTEIDPGGRAVYASNLEGLVTRLRVLEEEIRGLLSPCEARSFFVFHPTWGYFAEDFGLQQVPLERAGKEPSESELSALVRQVRARGARVVFVQPQIQGQSAQVIARAVGARVETLDPLAPDLAANLRRVAERLRAALCEDGG